MPLLWVLLRLVSLWSPIMPGPFDPGPICPSSSPFRVFAWSEESVCVVDWSLAPPVVVFFELQPATNRQANTITTSRFVVAVRGFMASAEGAVATGLLLGGVENKLFMIS